jgi:hypothetical protein
VGTSDMRDTPGCRRCGDCCRRFRLEATAADVLREPWIARAAPVLDGGGELGTLEWAWVLCDGTPCPFLADGPGGCRCLIYPTRPESCVLFRPGEPRCRYPAGPDVEALAESAVLAAQADAPPIAMPTGAKAMLGTAGRPAGGGVLGEPIFGMPPATGRCMSFAGPTR